MDGNAGPPLARMQWLAVLDRHYSPPSLVAAQVAEGLGYGKAAEDHAAWRRRWPLLE